MQHVAARPAEGAHVAGFFLAAEGSAGFGRGKAGIDRHHRLFLGEQDPVALLLGQIAPGNIHVVAEGHQDVALVLPVPCRRPCGDGAFADAQRRIGHHRLFGDFIDVAQAMTVRARPLRRIRREILGVQHGLPCRIGTGTRVQHPQQAGQGGDAADAGAHAGGAALLLQGYGRRQAFDGIHIRHADLVDQPAGIGRQGFQVTPLRLGVERAEGQRGFPRTGNAGEHHQRIAWNVDIHVLEVVFACAPDPHEGIRGSAGRRAARARGCLHR